VIQISFFLEENVKWGIAISALVTFASYVTVFSISMAVDFIYTGVYIFADLEFLMGTIFGVIFTLRNREPHQAYVKYGIIVAVVGGTISSVLIGLYHLILLAVFFGPIIFFLYFGASIISGIVIGIIGGAFIGTYYSYKEVKRESDKEKMEDDFYDDLVEK